MVQGLGSVQVSGFRIGLGLRAYGLGSIQVSGCRIGLIDL